MSLPWLNGTIFWYRQHLNSVVQCRMETCKSPRKVLVAVPSETPPIMRIGHIVVTHAANRKEMIAMKTTMFLITTLVLMSLCSLSCGTGAREPASRQTVRPSSKEITVRPGEQIAVPSQGLHGVQRVWSSSPQSGSDSTIRQIDITPRPDPGSAQSGSSSTTSEAKIPSDLPAELRSLIKRLYSANEEDCMKATKDLSAMGRRAMPAVPFLIERIGDGRLVGSLQVSRNLSTHFIGSSVGEEAVRALVNITGQDFGTDSTKWSDWWKTSQLTPRTGNK